MIAVDGVYLFDHLRVSSRCAEVIPNACIGVSGNFPRFAATLKSLQVKLERLLMQERNKRQEIPQSSNSVIDLLYERRLKELAFIAKVYKKYGLTDRCAELIRLLQELPSSNSEVQ